MSPRALVLLLAGALALAGCDSKSPASSSVRSGSTEAVATSSTIDRQRDMSVGKEATSTVELPLLPLLWKGLASGYEAMAHPSLLSEQDASQLTLVACGVANTVETDDQLARQAVEQLVDGSVVPWARDLFYEDDETTLRDRIALNRLCAYLIVGRYVTVPVLGWPDTFRNPESKNHGFMFFMSSFTPPTINYLDAVAQRVATFPTLSEDELVDRIVQVMEQTDGFAIEMGRLFSEDDSARGFRADRTGGHPAPVHFTVAHSSGHWDYALDGSGVTAIHDGVPVFGNGYINGKRYMVELVDTRSLTTTRSQESTTRQSTDIEAGVRGQASTQ